MTPRFLCRMAIPALVLVSCGGCLGGYVYPTMAVVPRVPVGVHVADEVHAFRVEITDCKGSVDLSGTDDYLFKELKINPGGTVPAQGLWRFGRGWWGIYHNLGYRQRLHPTIRVRLYRPGYQTVEVQPWEWRGKVKWVEARTLADQEKAIDDLVSSQGTNDLYRINPDVWSNDRSDYNVAPPRRGVQREALEFVAGEFDRLTLLAVRNGDTEAAARIRDKARQLRDVIAATRQAEPEG